MNCCNLCGEQKLIKLLDLGKHPIAHHFLKHPSQNEYVHSVKLYFCENCGLIQLVNPIPSELLYTNYVCLSSWKHQPHVSQLIHMIEKFTNAEKTSNILEVGSNDGSFLNILKNRGYRKLTGMEPARDAVEAAKQRNVVTIPSYFSCETAKEFVEKFGKCDLLISRQILEHINDLKSFQEAMRLVISPDAFVVFEVPNFACNLDMLDYSIWEEHINYFTPDTLSFFLANAGIQIIHSEKTVFSGETLIVIGKNTGGFPHIPFSQYIRELRTKALNYRDKWPVFRDAFIQYLREYKEKGDKVVAYGAGCRLCSLINFIGLGPYIKFVVDDQSEKQGLFMPGSKLPILPGDELDKHSTALCLLAVNAESEEKVIAKHQAFLKKGGSFVSILPPSNRLPTFWKEILH